MSTPGGLIDVPDKIGPEIHVVSAQGDGWVRAYQAETGEKAWVYDTNPKDSVWPETRNELIATPVVYRDRVFVVSGQDPQHGDGIGYLNVIDVTKRGDSTERARHFRFSRMKRALSAPVVANDLLYIADSGGSLKCLDARTGQVLWEHDLGAEVRGSLLLVGAPDPALRSAPVSDISDGRIYIGAEDGNVAILQAGRVKNVLATVNMGSPVYTTPVPAHNTLFVVTRNQLFALAAK